MLFRKRSMLFRERGTLRFSRQSDITAVGVPSSPLGQESPTGAGTHPAGREYGEPVQPEVIGAGTFSPLTQRGFRIWRTGPAGSG